MLFGVEGSYSSPTELKAGYFTNLSTTNSLSIYSVTLYSLHTLYRVAQKTLARLRELTNDSVVFTQASR